MTSSGLQPTREAQGWETQTDREEIGPRRGGCSQDDMDPTEEGRTVLDPLLVLLYSNHHGVHLHSHRHLLSVFFICCLHFQPRFH